jgi:hypothetical protein
MHNKMQTIWNLFPLRMCDLLRNHVTNLGNPFMQMGISIMIKKPDKQKPGVFSFMDPLNERVWICVITNNDHS